MWSGSELNLSQPFNGCERELRESTPRASAETKTRLETQTHTVSIHLSPVGGKKEKHTCIEWRCINRVLLASDLKGKWQHSRHGHSRGFWVTGHLWCNASSYTSKALCIPVLFYPVKTCRSLSDRTAFLAFMLLHFALNNAVVSFRHF